MDGIGGTVKNVVSWDVKSSKCIITSPKDFADYANATEWHQSPLYICLKVSYWKNLMQVKNAPTIPQTLQIHKIKRCLTPNGVCCLKFFYLATDNEHFFTQYYRKDDDPEVCGHDNIDQMDISICLKCGNAENGRDWLRCPICKMWFN